MRLCWQAMPPGHAPHPAPPVAPWRCLTWCAALIGALAAGALPAQRRSVPQLIEDLRESRERKRAAAELLAHPDREAVVGCLVDLLGSGSEDGRYYSTSAVAGREFRTSKRLPSIAPARFHIDTGYEIRDPEDLVYQDLPIRAIAAWLLGRLEGAAHQARGALLDALSSRDLHVVDSAARTLAKLGPEAADLLLSGTDEHLYALRWFPAGTLSEAVLLRWLRGASRSRRDCAIALCAHWRVQTPAGCAALQACADHDVTAAKCLEWLGPPGLPHLLALVQHRDRDVRAVAIAALGRATWGEHAGLLNALRAELAQIALQGEVEDAHLALTSLAGLPGLEAPTRDALAARVRAACGDPAPARRLVGFRHLGVFARSQTDLDAARRALTDEFDDVAWEAALASARLGGELDEEVLRRLVQHPDVQRTRVLLREHLRHQGARILPVLDAEAKVHSTDLLTVLTAAARGDATGLVTLATASREVCDLAADLLRDLGPWPASRAKELRRVAADHVPGLYVLVRAADAVEPPERLNIIRRALVFGEEQARYARYQDASEWVDIDALLMAALDAVATNDWLEARHVRAVLAELRVVASAEVRYRVRGMLGK